MMEVKLEVGHIQRCKEVMLKARNLYQSMTEDERKQIDLWLEEVNEMEGGS